jgi:CubicO group peptidase (beta-lactamase class C family)
MYTTNPFSSNYRGIGFDKPKFEGGGTCNKASSKKSYGHSGFTGTLAWADPEYQLNYVFLSNRVCPDQENRKIIDLHIRTEIQGVLYEAVRSRGKQ